MDEEMAEVESILTSVKKLLGLLEENEEFDSDIIVNINSAIMTLFQLGVGEPGFIITGKKETYKDLLGDNLPLMQNVKLYLYLKTRLTFDSPATQAIIQTTKETIMELEWRMTVMAENIQKGIMAI